MSTPETGEQPNSSFSALTSSVDNTSSPVDFLNSLLAPLLPPSLPRPNEPQPPSLQPIDTALNDLLTQLSLLSQDTASAIEQGMSDVSRTVPRLGYDLQFMRESASGLSVSLGMVQDRVARQADYEMPDNNFPGGEESEAVKAFRALEKITHLDKLKTRLESARDTLREAESWSTLESEITTLISEKEYAKAGQRLAEASRSMVVFKNEPAEWEERKRLLVSLGDELERVAGEALRDSLKKDDGVDEVRAFWEVFMDMEREEEFKGWYFKERGRKLLEAWKEPLVEEGQDENSSKLSDFLPKFYSLVLQTLSSELSYIPLVFLPESAPSILASFFQSTFDSLDPSFSNRLAAVTDYHGPSALPELVGAWESTVDLAAGVQGLIDKIIFNTQGGLLSGGAGEVDVESPATISTSPGISSSSPNHPIPRRNSHSHSKRHQSISRRFSRALNVATTSLSPSPGNLDDAWETTLYEPFLDWQSSYFSLEKRCLEAEVADLKASWEKTSLKQGGKHVVSGVISRTAELKDRLEEAVARCRIFTFGFGAAHLIHAVDTCISRFFDDERISILNNAKSERDNNKQKDKADELDLDELDEDDGDWNGWQVGLHILDSLQKVAEKLVAMEDGLKAELNEYAKMLKAQKGEKWDGEWGGRKATFGAVSLLQQSTLNTADLHALITSAPSPILPQSKSSLLTFIRESQIHLQQTILSPLLTQLDTYPSLAVWIKADKQPKIKKGELYVPQFSLSPTDVITRTSEGLLDLLRVFEVYGGEKALGWSLGSLPFVEGMGHAVALDCLSSSRKDKDKEPSTSTSDPTTTATSSAASVAPIPSPTPAPTPETIQTTWISSLTLSFLSHFTSYTLPSIRHLSQEGQAQLKEDLGYLENAVRALDVEWSELGEWGRVVEMEEEEWRENVKREGEEGVLAVVGRMRGWKV